MVNFIITNFISKYLIQTIPSNKRMNELQLTLMNRRRLSSEEAEELIQDMKYRVRNGESAEEVLFEYGLDAVFVIDLTWD